MQLFCLPHAGSSALNFFQWKTHMRQGVEIVPLEFPGRGEKKDIPPCMTMEELVEQVFQAFQNRYTGGIYAIFGHSLGAWVAYALYSRIEEEKIVLPNILFFSGNYPPFLQKEIYIHEKMKDEEVVERILALGGTARHIIENPGQYQIYLHTIRADFLVAQDFQRYAHMQYIQSNMVILGGTEDPNVSTRELLLWKHIAAGLCTILKIKGNHFFPFTNCEDTVALINKQIEAM